MDQGKVGADVTDGFFTDTELSRLFLAQRVRDPIQARAAVERGDLAGALVVPSDFTRRLNTGKPSELTVYTDPGRTDHRHDLPQRGRGDLDAGVGRVHRGADERVLRQVRSDERPVLHRRRDRRGRAQRERRRRARCGRPRRDDRDARQGGLDPLLLRGRPCRPCSSCSARCSERSRSSASATTWTLPRDAHDAGQSRRHRRRQDARRVRRSASCSSPSSTPSRRPSA